MLYQISSVFGKIISEKSAAQITANCDWTWQGQHGTQHSSHQNHILNVYSSYFSQA
ncbi:hypothetical protein ACTXT7_011711 [Hymenolepis weldensis]